MKRRNARNRMRPWIATVVAYALALQVLLTGMAAGHFMAAGDASASSLFVICHGNGSSDDQELPGKEPLAQSSCILCTLAKVPCAILPATMALRSAMQWTPRTLLLEQRGAFSSSIRPRASISAAPQRAFPFSADPLDRKPDRLTVRDDSVANHPTRLFPRVQRCRHFKTCHVSPARFQSASRIQADRRWPASKNGFPPGA